MFKVGIIGVGSMGSYHLNNFINGFIKNAEITAICDVDPKKMDVHKEKLGENVKYFENSDELIDSGLVDGIVVATPHYFHPTISIRAL